MLRIERTCRLRGRFQSEQRETKDSRKRVDGSMREAREGGKESCSRREEDNNTRTGREVSVVAAYLGNCDAR